MISWQDEDQNSGVRRTSHQLSWKKSNQAADLLYRYWDYVWQSTFTDLHMPVPTELNSSKVISEQLKALWYAASSICDNRSKVIIAEGSSDQGRIHSLRAKLLTCEVTSKAISDLVVLRAQIEEEFPEVYDNPDPLFYF